MWEKFEVRDVQTLPERMEDVELAKWLRKRVEGGQWIKINDVSLSVAITMMI